MAGGSVAVIVIIVVIGIIALYRRGVWQAVWQQATAKF